MGELQAVSAEVLAELRYDLPATYAFHRSVSCVSRTHVQEWLTYMPQLQSAIHIASCTHTLSSS